MTDKEITKALELCANNGDCKECAINPHKGNYGYCTSLAIKASLDLINRQKAEIERLKPFRDTAYEVLAGYYAIAKAEAIQEFAERLKSRLITVTYMNFDDTIDNLVKEMVGGE